MAYSHWLLVKVILILLQFNTLTISLTCQLRSMYFVFCNKWDLWIFIPSNWNLHSPISTLAFTMNHDRGNHSKFLRWFLKRRKQILFPFWLCFSRCLSHDNNVVTKSLSRDNHVITKRISSDSWSSWHQREKGRRADYRNRSAETISSNWFQTIWWGMILMIGWKQFVLLGQSRPSAGKA